MLLENKVAIIYGAGGSIGGAVAHAFVDVASDQARTITATEINISCGAMVG